MTDNWAQKHTQMITEWFQKPLETTKKDKNKLGPGSNPYLEQIITLSRAKLGPDNNFTSYIYTYTYIHIYIYIYLFSLSIYIYIYIYIYISLTPSLSPISSPMSKNTFFQKRCHFWFWAVSAETTIFYSVSWFTLFWAQKMFWPKQFLLGYLAFSIFLFFCFYFSNIKKTKTKNAIFFSKTSFLTSPKFCKNTVLAQCDTICFFNTPKHYKHGGNSEKLGPVLNTRLGPIFLTLETPNLGPFLTLQQIYVCTGCWLGLGTMYIHLHICMAHTSSGGQF